MVNWVFAREVGLPRWAWRTARRQWDKRIARRDSRLILPTGQPIVLARQSHSASEVFVTEGDIDWGAEALFARFADPARDFLDVGAHQGYYSLYLAPLLRRVVAFEPDPRNAAALQRNLALIGNGEHVAAAVSDREGSIGFDAGENTATGRVSDAGLPVRATTIDAAVAAHDLRPALIKIDVEGHDMAVLRGCHTTIATWQPLILTEFNAGEGDNDPAALRALLIKADYRAFTIRWRAGGGWLRARTRELARWEEAVAAGDRVKMIFLVPPHLRATFDRLVGQAM